MYKTRYVTSIIKIKISSPMLDLLYFNGEIHPNEVFHFPVSKGFSLFFINTEPILLYFIDLPLTHTS